MGNASPAERRSIPLAKWPEADRRLWQEQTEDGHGFDLDATPLGTWSRRHQAVARAHYGAWLRWMRDRGALEPGSHPRERADEARLMEFLEAEAERLSPGGLLVTAGNVIGVLRSMTPEREWGWVVPLFRRLQRRARHAPRGSRHIVPAEAIWELAWRTLEQAVEDDGTIAAGRFRDGLILGVLIAAPMRIANFAALEIGRHLRRGARWEIALEAAKTKTRQADHWPLPASLSEATDTYLNAVRPVLLGGSADTGRLWIGDKGRPMQGQAIRQRIKALTEAAFGRPVLPHSFRHSAVTSFTHRLPAHAAEAPAVLGHRSAATTERHYIIGQRLLMMETYHNCLRHIGRQREM